jgi:hypothetical protein
MDGGWTKHTLSVLVKLGKAALDHAPLLVLESLGTGHGAARSRRSRLLLLLLLLLLHGIPAAGVMAGHGRVGGIARLRAIHGIWDEMR